jgi:hypothetical protein
MVYVPVLWIRIGFNTDTDPPSLWFDDQKLCTAGRISFSKNLYLFIITYPYLGLHEGSVVEP